MTYRTVQEAIAEADRREQETLQRWTIAEVHDGFEVVPS